MRAMITLVVEADLSDDHNRYMDGGDISDHLDRLTPRDDLQDKDIDAYLEFGTGDVVNGDLVSIKIELRPAKHDARCDRDACHPDCQVWKERHV